MELYQIAAASTSVPGELRNRIWSSAAHRAVEQCRADPQAPNVWERLDEILLGPGQSSVAAKPGSGPLSRWFYSDGRIPWPIAEGKNKHQLIVCGDLVKALQTESRLAIRHHWGISLALISEYRRALGIERNTAGTWRLFGGP